VQNVIASLFNSHLSDFTAGWLYVFGVGVLGGTVLRQEGRAPAPPPACGAKASDARPLE
jgi:O-antigen ligase